MTDNIISISVAAYVFIVGIYVYWLIKNDIRLFKKSCTIQLRTRSEIKELNLDYKAHTVLNQEIIMN